MGNQYVIALTILLALSTLGYVPPQTGAGVQHAGAPGPVVENAVLHIGDWNVTENETYVNCTIFLEGNLTVLATGNLTLVNTTLMLNMTEDGQYWIEVHGSLTFSDLDSDPLTTDDQSVLRSNETAKSYTLEASGGSYLEFGNGLVSDCGYNSAHKGMVIHTANAVFEGMNFTDNYYGLSILEYGPVIRNCTFLGNTVGVEMRQAEAVFEDNSVEGSLMYGLYVYYCSPSINGSNFHSNTDGIYMRNSYTVIESCQISNSANSGIYSLSSSPLVVNSTLSNNIEMTFVTNSFPGFLNSSFNESRLNVGNGLYASVGEFVDVIVRDSGGTPMHNVTVSVRDWEGNPASSGVTDLSGRVDYLCFRERFITASGPIDYLAHEVMAFGLNQSSIWFGENVTTLEAEGECVVTVSQNPPDVYIWPESRSIETAEHYNRSKIFALDNVQVDWGGGLFLNDSEYYFHGNTTTPLSLIGMIGELDIQKGFFGVTGTSGPLAPGLGNLKIESGCRSNISSSSFSWVSKLEFSSDDVIASNISVDHASLAGVELGQYADPYVENLTVEWSRNGLNLVSTEGKVQNVTLIEVRDYGVYTALSNSIVANLTISGASKGVYALSTTLEASNFTVSSSGYGVHMLYSFLDLDDFTLDGCPTYGLYSQGSGLEMADSQIRYSATGLRVQDTELLNTLDRVTLSGNGNGVSVKNAHPLLMNSTLDNPIEVFADRGSAASLVNCTLNAANVSVTASGFVDLGSWVSVETVDGAMSPVNSTKVVVLDSEGRVSDSGVADANGTIPCIAFRQQRLLWNRTENHGVHTFQAFKTDGASFQGSNVTAVSPFDKVYVTVNPAPGDWLEWTDDHIVVSNEDYENMTIVADGDVEVDDWAALTLSNTSLCLYMTGLTDHGFEVTDGEFRMYNSSLMAFSVAAPMVPESVPLSFSTISNGHIAESRLSGLETVEIHSSSVAIDNTSFEHFAYSGIAVSGSEPRLENLTITMCRDGIYSTDGSPVVVDCSMIENGRYGAFASGGCPAFAGTEFVLNDYGMKLESESHATIFHCNASVNKYGFHFTSSSPVVEGSLASSNSNYGYFMSQSYAIFKNSTATQNNFGVYCSNSGPELASCDILDNNYGLYSYNSGPYLFDCLIEENNVGFYGSGDAVNLENKAFLSGREEEVATFVNGGVHSDYAIQLPNRASIETAAMSIEGIEIRNEAVIEDSYAQLSHTLDRDTLVWQDNRDGNWEIYSYDLSMDSDGNGVPNYMETPQLEDDPALFRITHDTGLQIGPYIWEDLVVWSDLRNGNFDIYAYSFANDTEWQIVKDPATQWNPAVYGDHIVWSDFRNGHYDVYMHNISTGDVSRLSTSTWDDMSPEIWGDKVVWYSYDGSPGGPEYSDIYLFNLTTWTLDNINQGDLPIQYTPMVYKDTVSWHDNRNGNWEIYLYDVITAEEERITFEKEQNFCPQIYEDKVVYYYHDRVKDIWSAMYYNATTGLITTIESRTYGDSHPMVYGDRIAWVNKSEGLMDVYVLDFGIIGYPENVTLDVGVDGDAEYQHAGTFTDKDSVDGTTLVSELRSFIPGSGGGRTTIPMEIQADGTGRVGLGGLSVIYDLPTYVVNTTISNNSATGAYCHGSRPWFINSTLRGNPTDFQVLSDGNPVALNTSFSEANLTFSGEYANLTVKNFLHLMAVNLTGNPVNATFTVSDNNQTVFIGHAGPDGAVEWLIVTYANHNLTGKHENVTFVTATFGPHQFASNPRSVNMSVSHWEFFVTDTIGPSVCNVFPPDGWLYPGQYPTVSVWLTDNDMIDASTMRLFVKGYSVFYNVTGVPGGYNVSYYHDLGYAVGEVVQCTVTARDCYGNRVNYSWTFTISPGAAYYSVQLIKGWNLVSIPLEPANWSVGSVLGSIHGYYDQVEAYDASDQADPWKTYSPHRPDALNDLEYLDAGAGFWVHVMTNCTLGISGSVREVTDVQLYAGWNLVSYPSLNQTTVAIGLWGTCADMVEAFDPSDPYLLRTLGPDDILEPGSGYWVRVVTDSVWTVDW